MNNPTITGRELSEVCALIEQRSGILFDDSRERFFSIRIREYMASRGLLRGAELLRVIGGSNAEYDAMLERMLTQETSFFRYPAAYEVLENRVLPDLRTKKFWDNPRSLRIWSAGCSTGEEPYSIAIALAETLEFMEAWNIRLLATDISRQALEHAECGLYGRRSFGVGLDRQEKYFTRVGEHYLVKPRIRNLVTFAPLNLAQTVYLGRFDVIFCMNVMIYFSEERRAALIQRFYDCLEPGGYLFLGHAEFVSKLPVKFDTIVHHDSIVYQKPVEASLLDPVSVSAEASL
ncbi:MAG: CheR family methyltransferase [Terriglobales bacterium]